MNKSDALVVFSGGQDSTTCLFWAKKHFRKVYALSFIYGQKHVKEVELARVIAGKAGVEFKAMDVSFIGNLGKNSLTDTTITMDEVKPADSFPNTFVPMTEAVAACFRRIIANRKTPKVEPMVEGYAGFLFLDKNDMPMVALHWEKYMEHIIQKYNKIYRIQMPKVTPHVCRHTYCSNMAKSGINPKTLQYLMGHSDISVTMNVYTHIGFDDAEEELKRMEEVRKAQAEVEKKNDTKAVSQKMFKVV